MKIRTRATAAIAAATVAALVGVSAPAYASASAGPATAESARTITTGQMITASGWMIAGVYNNDRWGMLACTFAGLGMKLAGQASAWYCAVDDQSGALFLWVLV